MVLHRVEAARRYDNITVLQLHPNRVANNGVVREVRQCNGLVLAFGIADRVDGHLLPLSERNRVERPERHGRLGHQRQAALRSDFKGYFDGGRRTDDVVRESIRFNVDNGGR